VSNAPDSHVYLVFNQHFKLLDSLQYRHPFPQNSGVGAEPHSRGFTDSLVLLGWPSPTSPLSSSCRDPHTLPLCALARHVRSHQQSFCSNWDIEREHGLLRERGWPPKYQHRHGHLAVQRPEHRIEASAPSTLLSSCCRPLLSSAWLRIKLHGTVTVLTTELHKGALWNS